jgi:hypothetical protein
MSVDGQRLAPVFVVRICTFQRKAFCFAEYDVPAVTEIMIVVDYELELIIHNYVYFCLFSCEIQNSKENILMKCLFSKKIVKIGFVRL